ncbi:MAG TPA: alpha/beta fold hydrolase [Thermomicrobiales bacterium]|nr:alpha/beta fold hydrolase [Thermomicrobiales bacterium]
MRTSRERSNEIMRSWYQDAIHQPFALAHGDRNRAGALLVHGFTGSPADMRALGEVVHARGLDVHVMRLPGMASEIDQLNDMTAEIWRDAVLRQWAERRQRYERTVLVGYSMGGALSLLAAAEESPDLLMLIAPLTRINDRRVPFLPVAKYVTRGVRPYARLKWDDPRVHEWFDRTRPSMMTRDPEHQQVMEHEAIYSARMLDELRRLLVQTRRSAPKVSSPTIILQGISDRIVLRRDTRELVTRIGGPVTYREMPGDHYLPLPAFDGWSRLCPAIDGELRAWMEMNEVTP